MASRLGCWQRVPTQAVILTALASASATTLLMLACPTYFGATAWEFPVVLPLVGASLRHNTTVGPLEQCIATAPQAAHREPAWLSPAADSAEATRGMIKECRAAVRLQAINTKSYNETFALRLAACLLRARSPARRFRIDDEGLSGSKGFAVAHEVAFNRTSRQWFINGGTTSSGETAMHGYTFSVRPSYAFHSAANWAGNSSRAVFEQIRLAHTQPDSDSPQAPTHVPPAIVCDRHFQVGVLTHASMGGVFDNYWHTTATYIQPLFWGTYDAEGLGTVDARQCALYTRSPAIMPWHVGTMWETAFSTPDVLRMVAVGRQTLSAMFGGRQDALASNFVLLDAIGNNTTGVGVDCIDRLYIRDPHPSPNYLDVDRFCCNNGASMIDMQWSWRQFMLQRFGLLATPSLLPSQDGARSHSIQTQALQIVWIYRSSATNKHVLNEGEIVSSMLAHLANSTEYNATVQVVDFNGMSERQQAASLMTADMAIGYRGAGMVYLVYLPPNSVMLCIHHIWA